MALTYKMAAMKINTLAFQFALVEASGLQQTHLTAQFSVHSIIKDISKEGIILNETLFTEKKQESHLTWTFLFCITFGETLCFYKRFSPVPVTLTCRWVFQVHSNTSIVNNNSLKERLLSTLEKAKCQRKRFLSLCFCSFCIIVFLFCSLRSLNQRCTAPFLWQCWRKYTKNTLFLVAVRMCAHSESLDILRSTAALVLRSDYCRSLPPVVEFDPTSMSNVGLVQ